MGKLTAKLLEGAIKKAYAYYPRCQISHFTSYKKDSIQMTIEVPLNGKPYGTFTVSAYTDHHVIFEFKKADAKKSFGMNTGEFNKTHVGRRYFTKTAYKYVHENMIADAEDLRSLLFFYSQIVLSGTESL